MNAMHTSGLGTGSGGSSAPVKGASAAPAPSAPKGVKSAQGDAKKVGLIGLTAIVISAMVGGGIYDLPQNMAASASAQPPRRSR